MRIEVSGVGLPVSQTLRATVLAQVLLALSRFGPRVTRVSVRLARAANPLGGVDQCCGLHARLLLGEDVRAEAIDGTIEAAVARAAQRLARRISGALLDGRPLASAPRLLPAAAGRRPRPASKASRDATRREVGVATSLKR